MRSTPSAFSRCVYKIIYFNMFYSLFRQKVDEICIFLLVEKSQKEDKYLIMNKVNNQLYCVINYGTKKMKVIPLNDTYKEMFNEDPRKDLKVFNFNV